MFQFPSARAANFPHRLFTLPQILTHTRTTGWCGTILPPLTSYFQYFLHQLFSDVTTHSLLSAARSIVIYFRPESSMPLTTAPLVVQVIIPTTLMQLLSNHRTITNETADNTE